MVTFSTAFHDRAWHEPRALDAGDDARVEHELLVRIVTDELRLGGKDRAQQKWREEACAGDFHGQETVTKMRLLCTSV